MSIFKQVFVVDQELDRLQTHMDAMPQAPGSQPGRIWVKPRRTAGRCGPHGTTHLEELLSERTNDRTFREAFKCSKTSFLYLVAVLEDELAPAELSFRPDTIQSIERVALALHWMCHKGEVSQTSGLFARGESTLLASVDMLNWGGTHSRF